MRVAGVRTPSGSLLWLDAREYDLATLDEVTCDTPDGTAGGLVVVTPEQLLRLPSHIDGTITAVASCSEPDLTCDDLPGADLPQLGGPWLEDGIPGMIVGIDAVERRVTVRRADGTEVKILVGSGGSAS